MLRRRCERDWILCALVLLLLSFSVLASERPDWVTGLGGSAQYPTSLFLTGFGQSEESQESADDRARGDLAMGIRTTVYSEVVDSLSDEVSKTSVFTRCVSDLTLEGVAVKRYAKKRTYYALAVLERSSAGELLEGRIEDHHTSAQKYHEQARGHEADRMYDLALRNYLLAEEAYTRAMSMEMIHQVVSIEKGTLSEEADRTPILPELQTRIEQIVSRMRLSAVSGDGQSIGYGVEPEPVCARLTVVEGDTAYPVGGIPVSFSLESGTGKVEDRVDTDQRGRACTPVYDPRSDIKNRLVVRARVASESFAEYLENPHSLLWIGRMGQQTCTFTFRFEKAPDREFTSLEEVFRWLAYALNRYVTASQKILIGSFTYRTSGIGGEFAEYLRDRLSVGMTDLGMNVSRPEEVQYAMRSVRTLRLRGYAEPALAESYAKQMGKDLSLTGTYWDIEDRMEIVVRLVPSAGKGKRVTRRVAFSSELLPRGMSLRPDNFEQAQSVAAVFEHDRPVSSGFDVRLWLDRPKGSTYVEGEQMVVYCTANRNSHIRLIYHDAYGDNYEIFPNGCEQGNVVPAGTVKSIGDPKSPLKFVIQGPPFGVERLWVHASTAPLHRLPGELVGEECTFLKLTGTTEEIVSTTRGVSGIQMGASGSVLRAEDSVTITTMSRP